MTDATNMSAATPLFSEDELMHVLSEIDTNARTLLASRPDEANTQSGSGWQSSVDVVPDYNMFEGDEAFAGFMAQLATPDDSGSDETTTTSTSAGSPPPSASTSSTGTPSPNRLKGSPTSTEPAPKPSRKRRKHELDHLRGVAAALEAKLHALNDRANVSKAGGKFFWRHVSSQMMLEKQKTLGENARLREILRDQVKVVKSLQRSLAKSPDLRKLGIIPEPKIAGSRDGASTQERFKGLFRNVSSSYNSMETMFQQAGVPPPTLTGNRKINMEMRCDGDVPRMCLQIVESRKMPFGFLHVGEQAWKFLSAGKGTDPNVGGFEMAFQNQGDDLYGECKLHCDEGPLRLKGDVAMRRYVENDRLTFVWECAGVCHTSLQRVQQKGWCMIEPLEEDPSNATLFRACVRITPTAVEGTDFGTSPKEIGATTEFVLDNYERTVGFIFDQILGSLTSEA